MSTEMYRILYEISDRLSHLEKEVSYLRNTLMDKARTNYQYSEYQIQRHQAHCFCGVHDCPYCLSISRNLSNNAT